MIRTLNETILSISIGVPIFAVLLLLLYLIIAFIYRDQRIQLPIRKYFVFASIPYAGIVMASSMLILNGEQDVVRGIWLVCIALSLLFHSTYRK